MGTPHKHAALIKAWADGAEIQEKALSHSAWVNVSYPVWYSTYEYRIKPKTIKYRVALCKVGDLSYTATANNDSGLSCPENTHFVGWLTDWVEVEV